MSRPRHDPAVVSHAPAVDRTPAQTFHRGSALGGSGSLGESPLRRWWGPGLAALFVPLLLVWWLGRPAPSLADVAIEGPRGPSCLRLVVAADVSGSMADVTAARDRALAQFLAWAPANLRSDDEVAVVEFAQTAGEMRGPTAIGGDKAPLTTSKGALPVRGDHTLLGPVLGAVGALPTTDCDTALALVSDGQYSDLPTRAEAGLEALRRAGVRDLALLVPSRAIDVPPQWEDIFPTSSPQAFDGLDARATGLALGTLVAHLTGQRLAPS